MLKRSLSVLIALLLFLAPCVCVAEGVANTQSYTAQEIFANFVGSVVQINTSNSGGTGFFIEENLIVTNNHVIADADWLKVTLNDGSQYDVTKIIARSENPDLALLEVSCSGTPLAFNTHGISEGEPVYAIGGPMGIYPCISDGIVMKSSHVDNGINFILSNFHSIGGNSGGPLLNAYGELMGVVVGGMVDGPNSIDLVINADYIPLMDRNNPTDIMTEEEYLAYANKPEEEKFELADFASAQPGMLVTFGRYEQDNDLSNGPEDIYWLVEENNDGELVLLSLYCLDVVPYHTEATDVTWENAYVRQFLNEDFFHSAFTAEEQDKILTTTVGNAPNPVHGTDGGSDTQDKVYLLSLEEVMRYYDILECQETYYRQLYGCASPYTMSKGVWLEIEDSTRCWWWLRSPGGNPANASEVGSAGYFSVNGSSVDSTERAVRPAIRIDAKEEQLAYANRPEEERYELADIATAEPGKLVIFGRYEQDNDLSNGPEDIYWLVQEKNGNELVLESLYCLDVVPYHTEATDITWEHSHVRQFLNEDFFGAAFTAEEQNRIQTTTVVNAPNPVYGTDGGNDTQDKVYLLSLEEVMRYHDIPQCEETFYDHLYARASQYTVSKGVSLEIENSDKCWWWLRSPGGRPSDACEVGPAGYFSVNGSQVDDAQRAVRPVIRIHAE